MQPKALLYQSLEWAARLYVFVFINIYGLGKMAGGQFYQKGHFPAAVAAKPVTELSGFELAWSFFGHAYPYILFIGLSQVLGGFLLLFERTKLLGVAVLLPILTNIILVDGCFGIPEGALWSAVIYLLLLLLVLYWNRQKVWAAWQVLTAPPLEDGAANRPWWLFGLAILWMAVLFFIEVQFIRG